MSAGKHSVNYGATVIHNKELIGLISLVLGFEFLKVCCKSSSNRVGRFRFVQLLCINLLNCIDQITKFVVSLIEIGLDGDTIYKHRHTIHLIVMNN